MKLLHITDMHLETNPYLELVVGCSSVERLEFVLKSVFDVAEPPQLIVATGDIVNTPTQTNYETARSIFEKYQVPVFVVPGNHDDVAEMRRSLLTDNILFDPVCGMPSVDWCVVSLNSQVEHQSYGEVSINDQCTISDLIDRAEAEHALIAVHHTPFPKCEFEGCQFYGVEEFIATLSDDPRIKLLLSGHVHYGSVSSHDCIKLISTNSSYASADHLAFEKTPDSFMKVHRFDPTNIGVTMLDLQSSGEVAYNQLAFKFQQEFRA